MRYEILKNGQSTGQVVLSGRKAIIMGMEEWPVPASHDWDQGLPFKPFKEKEYSARKIQKTPLPSPTPDQIEAVRVSDIKSIANRIISSRIDPLDWSNMNDILALRLNRVIRQYAEMVTMLNAAADFAAFKTAMHIQTGSVNNRKDHWQKVADNAKLFNDLYNNNVNPIKTWIDKVTANANGLIDGSILPENADWERFEQGSGHEDRWRQAWTNALNRFATA